MEVTIQDIQNSKYVILKRTDLEDLLINVRQKTQVDKRVKWIDRKTATAKYGVSRYWLETAEKDIFSLLKVSKLPGKTSKKRYLESSIIEEQNRQASV